jgi:hypothetical protein
MDAMVQIANTSHGGDSKTKQKSEKECFNQERDQGKHFRPSVQVFGKQE